VYISTHRRWPGDNKHHLDFSRQHQGTYPGSLKWYAQLNFRSPDGVVEGSKMEGAVLDGFGGWESGSKGGRVCGFKSCF